MNAPAAGDDASTVWLVSYSDDDDRELRSPQIAEALRLGEITADTIVWRQGADDWLPLAKVPELAKLLSSSGETATAPLVAPVPGLLRSAPRPPPATTATPAVVVTSIKQAMESTAIKAATPSTKPMIAGRSVPAAKGTTKLGMPKLDPKKERKADATPLPNANLPTTPKPAAKVAPAAPADMTPTLPKSPAAAGGPIGARASTPKADVFGSSMEDEEAPISIEPEFLRPPSPAPARAMQRAKALSAGTLGMKQPAPPPRPPMKSAPDIEQPKKTGAKQPAPPPRPPQKSVPQIELPKNAGQQSTADAGTPSLGTLAAPVRVEAKLAPEGMLNAEELLQRAVALDATAAGATAEPAAAPAVDASSSGTEPSQARDDNGASATPTEPEASAEPPEAKDDAQTDAPVSEARGAAAPKPAGKNPWPILAAVAAVVLVTWVFMRGKRDAEPDPSSVDPRPVATNVAEPAAPAEPKAPEPTAPEEQAPAMTAAAAPAEPAPVEPAKSPAAAAAKETTGAAPPIVAAKTETSSATKETKSAPAAPQARTEAKPAETKPAESKPAAPRAPEPKEVAVGGDFDTSAAAAALGSAAQEASGCRKEGDPSGVAVVHVTFSNAGRATRAVIEGPPFAGTQTGGCIASTLRKATVPPYGGDRVTVTKRVTIH